MNACVKWMVSACALALVFAISAQAAARDTMQSMKMPERQHPQSRHAAPPDTVAPASAGSVAAPHGMDMMEMPMAEHHGSPHAMRANGVPAGGRSPDYSDGYRYGPMTGMDMRDDPTVGVLLLNRMEYVHGRDGSNALAVDGEAWYGRNLDKLWLKFEGEHADGRLQDLRTEALWAHAIAPFWDTQLGVRHDFGAGPGRTWAAFGVEGLAPYWFETEATFYLGQGGRTAARVAVEYEVRFTQRLILQPSLEANFYGRDDPQRSIGSGLSDIEAGLRLRYEIRREFAPYIGVVWQQRLGHTRDFARAQGESADDLQFVAGFRAWF